MAELTYRDAVAAGIALYEAVRQRGSVPTMARPIPPRALVAKKPVVIGPPPEDREEDPGARRRAAAIASLSAAPEPVRAAKPEPAVESVPAKSEDETAKPRPSSEADETERSVPEASLERIEPARVEHDRFRAGRPHDRQHRRPPQGSGREVRRQIQRHVCDARFLRPGERVRIDGRSAAVHTPIARTCGTRGASFGGTRGNGGRRWRVGRGAAAGAKDRNAGATKGGANRPQRWHGLSVAESRAVLIRIVNGRRAATAQGRLDPAGRPDRGRASRGRSRPTCQQRGPAALRHQEAALS